MWLARAASVRRALLTWAILTAIAGMARAQEPAGIGTVAAIEGTAEVLHAGSTTGEPLKPGDHLVVGDKVRTPPGSKVQLQWGSSVLTLGTDGTAINLRAPSTVELTVGTLRSLISKPYREPRLNFDVDGQTAEGITEGTEFITRYDAARDTALFLGVYDAVRVRSKVDPQGRHEVRLTSGLATEVARGKLPTRPYPLPEAQRRELLEATELLTGGLNPETELEPGLPAGLAPALAEPGREAKTPESEVIDQPLNKLTPPPKPPLPPPIPPPTAQPAGRRPGPR